MMNNEGDKLRSRLDNPLVLFAVGMAVTLIAVVLAVAVMQPGRLLKTQTWGPTLTPMPPPPPPNSLPLWLCSSEEGEEGQCPLQSPPPPWLSPSASPPAGCSLYNFPLALESRGCALEGPTEFYLTVQWDNIADAQRFGDDRTVEAYLKTPVSEGSCSIRRENLANQCMQPDGNTRFGVARPAAGCGGEVLDDTEVELVVKVKGSSPDGHGLKITGWENCSSIQNVSQDEGNVSALKCVGSFGEWKKLQGGPGGKELTVKVRSTYRNYKDGFPLGEGPSCPGDPDCEAPTCYDAPEVDCGEPEILGHYDCEDGMDSIQRAIAFPPALEVQRCGISELGADPNIRIAAEQVWRITMWSKQAGGTTFFGTIRQLAAQMTRFSLSKGGFPVITSSDVVAMIRAGEEAKRAGGAAVFGGGAGAGGASVVSSSTAACLARAGLYGVIIGEVAFVGWEVYDIGSSASAYCKYKEEGEGGLAEFFKEFGWNYWQMVKFWDDRPEEWCRQGLY